MRGAFDCVWSSAIIGFLFADSWKRNLPNGEEIKVDCFSQRIPLGKVGGLTPFCWIIGGGGAGPSFDGLTKFHLAPNILLAASHTLAAGQSTSAALL